MATLDDLKTVLDSINTNISSQSAVLSSILTSQEAARADQERFSQLLRADRSSSGSGNGRGSGGGAGGGIGSSIGAGLGAIGLGAAGATAGIGALGLAMPAFFGGLLLGDQALGWLSTFGSGFDFENLKAAAVGFTDIILEMDKEALIVLGGLMGISVIGGTRAAAGLGSMGFAISAFLGGLLAGDLVFSGVSALGGNLNFESMKSVLSGFSDMILSMSEESLLALGVIMGGAAVTGMIGKDSTGAAKALGSMGLGITGFLGGLLLGNTLFAGANAIGADLDFGSLRSTLVGFSGAIDALTPAAATALAAIIGASGVAAIAAKGTGLTAALETAAIMTGIGAGVSGLMLALHAGGEGVEWIKNAAGMDGTGLRSSFETFSSSIDALSPAAATALAAIIGASGVAALATKGTGVRAAIGTAAIMTGIGAGISGLMIGLAGGGAVIDMINGIEGVTGQGLASAFKMFNDSIGELNNENAIKALIAIVGAGSAIGGIVGAISPGMAAKAGLGITAIMTGIGAGIAGLFIGLATGGKIVDIIESIPGGDGDGLVSVFKMFNDSVLAITPEAITKLKELTEIGGLDLAGALGGLSAGMVALFGAGGLAQLGEGLKAGALDAIDWLFGTNYSDSNKSTIQFLVDSLQPLSGLDLTLITKMDEFGGAVERFAASFSTLESINAERSASNLTAMIKDVGGVLTLMDHLMTGEPYDPRSGVNKFMQNLFGNESEIIRFGPGLNNMDFNKLEDLAAGINAIRSVFSGVVDESVLSGITTVNGAGANGGVAPPVNLTVAPVDARSTSVEVRGGTSNNPTTIYGGGSSDIDFFSRPVGAQ